MKKFFSIFLFEFYNYVKNKIFILLTVSIILILGIIIFGPGITEFMKNDDIEATESQLEMIAVKDENNYIFHAGIFEDDILRFDETPNTILINSQVGDDDLIADVESEKYHAAIIVDSPNSYRYVVKTIGIFDETQYWIDEVLKNSYSSNYIAGLGVGAEQIKEILNPDIKSEVVLTGIDQSKNFMYTYVLILSLYIVIMLYGQFVATSVAIEKSTRAMELLITSANCKSLVFGKVLGTGCAGLLQFILIIGSGFMFYNLNSKYYLDNGVIQSVFNIPVDILLFAFLFLILGFFIYAFIHAALASMVSRMEQLNTATMPAIFLLIAVFFIVIFSILNGNTESFPLIFCSYFPLTSPMAMFARIAMGSVAPVEIAISIGILIISVFLIGYLATAIYRVGVLMYGQPPKIRELIATLKTNKSNIG